MSASASPAAARSIATREQFATQQPALLTHRRADAAASSAHAPLKRRTSGGDSAAKRAKAAAAANGDDDAAPSDHLLAPCFSVLPVLASVPAATAIGSLPAIAASTSSYLLPSATPSKLSKRAAKSLGQDYSAYVESVHAQSLRVMAEALPRQALHAKQLEEQFERDLATLHQDQAKTTNDAAYHFAAPVVECLAKSNSQLGVMVQQDKRPMQPAGAMKDDDKPIARFGDHKPTLHPRLPALSAPQTQHGWTFLQPATPHALHAFNTRWVGLLLESASDFLGMCGVMRTSLALSAPSAHDTNNADAELLDLLSSEVKYQADWAANLRGRLLHYSVQRAKLLSKTYKYPGVPDYRASVRELDEYTELTLKTSFGQLRFAYLWLSTQYRQNEDKLTDPTGMHSFNSMI